MIYIYILYVNKGLEILESVEFSVMIQCFLFWTFHELRNHHRTRCSSMLVSKHNRISLCSNKGYLLSTRGTSVLKAWFLKVESMLCVHSYGPVTFFISSNYLLLLQYINNLPGNLKQLIDEENVWNTVLEHYGNLLVTKIFYKSIRIISLVWEEF